VNITERTEFLSGLRFYVVVVLGGGRAHVGALISFYFTNFLFLRSRGVEWRGLPGSIVACRA